MFKPGILNLICPTYYSTKNRFAQIMSSAEYVLSKQMSYENLFLHLIHYERLKKILLSEDQSTLIENHLKVKQDEFKEVQTKEKNLPISNVEVINFNGDVNGVRNLKRFSNNNILFNE